MKRRSPSHLTMPQIARIEQLALGGLSDAAIAVVLNVDYPGLGVAAQAVRYHRVEHCGIRHAHGQRLLRVSTDNGANFPVPA